jgi:hypothetical protein
LAPFAVVRLKLARRSEFGGKSGKIMLVSRREPPLLPLAQATAGLGAVIRDFGTKCSVCVKDAG